MSHPAQNIVLVKRRIPFGIDHLQYFTDTVVDIAGDIHFRIIHTRLMALEVVTIGRRSRRSGYRFHATFRVVIRHGRIVVLIGHTDLTTRVIVGIFSSLIERIDLSRHSPRDVIF